MASENRRPQDRREDELADERIQSYDNPGDRPARDTEDWIDSVGPEDMDRDRVVQNLEEYGFDILDDDEQLSLESTDQEFGGAYQNGAYTDVEETGDLISEDTPLDAEQQTSLRPTEDETQADLDPDDERLDDDLPAQGTQPSGLQ